MPAVFDVSFDRPESLTKDTSQGPNNWFPIVLNLQEEDLSTKDITAEFILSPKASFVQRFYCIHSLVDTSCSKVPVAPGDGSLATFLHHTHCGTHSCIAGLHHTPSVTLAIGRPDKFTAKQRKHISNLSSCTDLVCQRPHTYIW